MKYLRLITTILFFSMTTTFIFPYKAVNALSQSPIKRSEAQTNALNMINLSWSYDSSTNSKIALSYSPYVTKPKQFTSPSNFAALGIPYNWGGLDSLASNSFNAPWNNFLDAIKQGAYAGNVNTEAGYGYIPGTAGIDCSGFVQATFNIKGSKLSTSTMFDSYFSKINLNDIKHMDILDKPGDHVVVFDRWGTLNGINGAYTYEATPDDIYGGIQGTKKYFMSMDEINKGYIPGRYVNIVEDSLVDSVPLTENIFAKISNIELQTSLKASPSSDALNVSSIPNNAIVYLIDSYSDWYQISFNGKVGWVWSKLICPIPTGKYVAIKNASSLNIRTSPSTTATIIGALSKNQYAEVLSYSTDGNWIKIRINGIEGYSSIKYLSYIY